MPPNCLALWPRRYLQIKEPGAPAVPRQSLCCSHGFAGLAALVLSAFRSVQETGCLQVDQCSVAGLGWELGLLGGSLE